MSRVRRTVTRESRVASNLVKTDEGSARPVVSRTLPITQDELRLQLLASVGFTPAHLAKMRDRLVEALDAEIIESASYRGVIMDERVRTDHRTRLKAMRELALLFNLYPQQREAAPPQEAVKVIIPEWADVTPAVRNPPVTNTSSS